MGCERSDEVSVIRLAAESSTDLARIPGRNWTKADVRVRAVDGGRVAIKDYAPRGFLVRNTVGRFFTRREARAFESARGAPGVAIFRGRVSPFAIATDWIEGSPLEASALDALDAVVRGLHARGIALGDLHRRDVLVARDGSPWVVDLATAVVLGDRPGLVRRAVFERFRDQDLVALARIRARAEGRSAEEAVAAIGGRAAAWHARGRRMKRLLDRLRGR